METFSAADGFVIAMLTVMALSMGIIGVLLLCMRANVARRDRHVDDLLDEVDEEEKRSKRVPKEESRLAQAWERDGDWWKK
jgi:hypothetical protein